MSIDDARELCTESSASRALPLDLGLPLTVVEDAERLYEGEGSPAPIVLRSSTSMLRLFFGWEELALETKPSWALIALRELSAAWRRLTMVRERRMVSVCQSRAIEAGDGGRVRIELVDGEDGDEVL